MSSLRSVPDEIGFVDRNQQRGDWAMNPLIERVARAIWNTRRKGRLRGHAGLHLTWDEIAEPEKHSVNPYRLAELAADIRDEARAALAATTEVHDG